MSSKPAATVGSMHTCPMCSGTTPHVGGPITTGETGILHNNKPAATIGSLCTCATAADTIVQGFSGILHNGKPAVAVDHMTAHGGKITTGEIGILHGFVTEPIEPYTQSVNKIPFPKFSFTNKVLGNAKEAQANQQALRDQESQQGEPNIINPRWIDEQTITRNSRQIRQITLVADVINIPDGNTATFTFDVPEIFDRPQETVTLSGEVQDKQVEIIWEIEELEDPNTI